MHRFQHFHPVDDALLVFLVVGMVSCCCWTSLSCLSCDRHCECFLCCLSYRYLKVLPELLGFASGLTLLLLWLHGGLMMAFEPISSRRRMLFGLGCIIFAGF